MEGGTSHQHPGDQGHNKKSIKKITTHSSVVMAEGGIDHADIEVDL